MDSIDLTVGPAAARPVLAHLSSRAEMVAFMRGDISRDEAVVDDAWLLQDDDVLLSEWHVALADDAQQRLIRWATGSRVLVEAHSHGRLGGPTMFSRTDLDGLAAWVPHLTWRLPGLTYIALVLGAEAFDGVAWRAGRGPLGVGRILFHGEGEWQTTGRSLPRWKANDG